VISPVSDAPEQGKINLGATLHVHSFSSPTTTPPFFYASPSLNP
jgi:hypothetical protein